MSLPALFEQRMQGLLGAEYGAFAAALREAPSRALRANLLKISPEALSERMPGLEHVPWATGGFYTSEQARPGRHPYHAAGLYYIQEPSAMAAAAALAPRPGERVLDLCGAPGGKATHLAGLMKGQGLLIANEIVPRRARVLLENLERMGTTHAAVTNEEPERLSSRFPEFFDRVLVDAPCSGEGMFRKLPLAHSEWGPEVPAACAARQRAILPAAVAMLRPGGHLLYSTCTFSPEENEAVVAFLLERYPELQVLPLTGIPGAQPGRPEWSGGVRPELAHTVRLWPHRVRGEGHYLALLKKRGEGGGADRSSDARAEVPGRSPARRPRDRSAEGPSAAAPTEAVRLFERFASEVLRETVPGPYRLYGDLLVATHAEMPDLSGLRLLRAGLLVGEVRKGRFEPAHALALSLKPGGARPTRELPPGGPEVFAYLRGEALPGQGERGWTLVTVDGFPLGWAKGSDGWLKNHYPKSLRWSAGGLGQEDLEEA